MLKVVLVFFAVVTNSVETWAHRNRLKAKVSITRSASIKALKECSRQSSKIKKCMRKDIGYESCFEKTGLLDCAEMSCRKSICGGNDFGEIGKCSSYANSDAVEGFDDSVNYCIEILKHQVRSEFGYR
ncbi:MAG: hypothetical protein HOE90_20005 [Bacteriovoracaceae bacterium]|nr:hypothetical protein [Bacteriovoracaceae bacterium]